MNNVIYGRRVAAWRKSVGLSQRALGAAISVSQGYIGDIESGRSGPSREFLAAMSDKFGVNPSWILDGQEPITFTRDGAFVGRTTVIESPDKARPGHGELVIQGKDYAWVRRMGLSVSAGSGLEELEPDDEDGLLLPTAWFSRRGINPDLCVIVSVRGESMAPTIPDGAMVLIDCTKKTVETSGIYAVALDGQAYVKRLIPSRDSPKKPPSAILMVSDSPSYTPVPLVGDRMNALRIVGRVRAVLSDL